MKLNIEQRKIIELDPAGHMLVKGVAGSGKTTVAVRRIHFLREHYCPEKDDRILLVTFNKTLLKYIQYQYENLEQDNTLHQHDLFGRTVQVELKNIDQLMFSFFMKYQQRYKVSYKIVSSKEARDTVQQSILKVQERYKEIEVMSLRNANFLLDEIQWIKACNISDLATYQEIDRIGRSTGSEGSPQKLTKNSHVREAIYSLMEMYDRSLLQKGLVDFKTMNILALQEVTEGNYQSYTHIIIDESQDLSKVQLQFLKALHASKTYASIMFVADNTQSIYSQSWLGKGRPYTTIGYDMSGKSRTLSKNYRTTTEISKAAYSLIEEDESIKGNADFIQPSLIDRHGHAPIYQYFTNHQQQTDFLINEIKILQNDYSLRDICIIGRTQRIIDNVQTMLEIEQIPSEELRKNDPKFANNSVKLTTMHSIKGLEFKVVFLINLDEGIIPNNVHGMMDDETLNTEERKLLYVGMTRASELLYLSSVNRPSKFIRDINSNYLRFQKEMALRPFRSVALQDYRLAEQINDLNGQEEIVRQWLLRQLEQVYRYPLELIMFEYAVQQFSKKGYVDMAVSIEINGKRTPYIFIEVKKFASGIEEGFDQLLSYMNANEKVQYGVVTDGVDIRVVNRNGEEVVDIPPCQPQFTPDTKQTRQYINLKNQTMYHYKQDIDDENIVEIVDPMTKLTVAWDVDNKVPLIGNVAAGIPNIALEDYEETLLLPKEWIVQIDKTYALRVTGDSMIDMNIEEGDYVIVHQQTTASQGDIVIALIGEEATMKEFMQMGGTILLIAKNSKYEPIQMNAEDVTINGKVIGVLKKN